MAKEVVQQRGLAIEFVKNNRPHDAAPKRRRKAAEEQEPPKNALEEV